MRASLNAHSLSLGYRGGAPFKRRTILPALQGVNLSVSSGESIGLVGGSGAGKSTLLRILLALQKPDAGSVEFNGRPVAPGPARSLRWYRHAVQYIPQNPAASLAPGMSVEQLLLEPLRQLRIRGDHRNLILGALERVDLDRSLLKRRPNELSGGQNQRVAIARALAPAPKIRLADEPTSGLDLPLRNTVLAVMEQLISRDGLGLVLVSHDVAAVARLCSRAMVLSSGRIVEEGHTATVFARPQAPETRELVASVPRLERVAAGSKGAP